MSIMKHVPPPPMDDNVWTLAELKTARLALGEEITELRQVLAAIAVNLASQALNFMDHGGGEATDMGALLSDLDASTLLVTNSIDVLEQCEKAVQRITHLSYGTCELCDRPIGKARLQALPRASLCVQCQ